MVAYIDFFIRLTLQATKIRIFSTSGSRQNCAYLQRRAMLYIPFRKSIALDKVDRLKGIAVAPVSRMQQISEKNLAVISIKIDASDQRAVTC